MAVVQVPPHILAKVVIVGHGAAVMVKHQKKVLVEAVAAQLIILLLVVLVEMVPLVIQKYMLIVKLKS